MAAADRVRTLSPAALLLLPMQNLPLQAVVSLSPAGSLMSCCTVYDGTSRLAKTR